MQIQLQWGLIVIYFFDSARRWLIFSIFLFSEDLVIISSPRHVNKLFSFESFSAVRRSYFKLSSFANCHLELHFLFVINFFFYNFLAWFSIFSIVFEVFSSLLCLKIVYYPCQFLFSHYITPNFWIFCSSWSTSYKRYFDQWVAFQRRKRIVFVPC